MYLLGKRVDDLNEDDIRRIVQNKMQENKSLDYKKELKLEQDGDKKDFLFDVASMANTEGGCLIYGIAESEDERGKGMGTPGSIVGIVIDNYDKLSQKIEDIVKGNTEPSISIIALKCLSIDGKNVLIIGIPKTLGLPTMVTFNQTNKFYRRGNSRKYAVDVYELNQMFMQNQILKENAEKFRIQRIEKVKSGKVFPNLATDNSFFIHIIPFSFQNEKVLDLTNAHQTDLFSLMKPMTGSIGGGYDTMFNVDGFATWTGARLPKTYFYNQLFRNGIYEIYTGELFTYHLTANGQSIFCMYGLPFIPDVLEKINSGLTVLKKFQVEPPFIVSISMMGMKGAVIYSTHSWGKPFLVDEIYLPPVLISNFPASKVELYEQLKPTFDIIWQAVSENQSPQSI